MSYGLIIESWISCDGENVLGDHYDGNVCELTSADAVTDAGGHAPVAGDHVTVTLAKAWRVARDGGWHVTRDGRHICPACTRRLGMEAMK